MGALTPQERAAADLRLFSKVSTLEAMIDAIPNERPRSPEAELNLLIRNWIIDGLAAFEPVIANLAAREVIRAALEAAEDERAA
jgi:hypothetical protein